MNFKCHDLIVYPEINRVAITEKDNVGQLVISSDTEKAFDRLVELGFDLLFSGKLKHETYIGNTPLGLKGPYFHVKNPVVVEDKVVDIVLFVSGCSEIIQKHHSCSVQYPELT